MPEAADRAVLLESIEWMAAELRRRARDMRADAHRALAATLKQRDENQSLIERARRVYG